MFKSWDLGKFAGINVRIHWTFWLVMILYSLSAAFSGGVAEGAMTAVTLALIFACVLAHEFGHAFAAAAFGIPTHDITLLPIGGLARLARVPDKPMHELIIALAGPAVNVVIAVGLLLLTPVRSLAEISQNPTLMLGGNLIEYLLFANVFLVLFNMLPAFPMDGGRVLRSLLAMRTSHLRATEIAARVGRWMALFFIIAGIWWLHVELCLIGVFVLLSGTGELFDARRRAMSQMGPQASPWFRYQWASVGPSGVWQFSNYPAADRPAGSADIVDAVDVREVRNNNRLN